jgi:hypothetical protein
MSKFKVGQVVRVPYGLGVIVSSNGSDVSVRHFRKCSHFHNLHGMCDDGHGWYYCYTEVQILPPINPINKLLYPDYEEKDGYLVPKGEI